MLISCCGSCWHSLEKYTVSNNKRMAVTVSGQIKMVMYFPSREDRPDWGHVKWKSQTATLPKRQRRHSSFQCSTPQQPSPDLCLKGFSNSFKATGKVGLKIDLKCKNKNGFKCASIDWIEYRRECLLSILRNGKLGGKPLRHKTASYFSAAYATREEAVVTGMIPHSSLLLWVTW